MLLSLKLISFVHVRAQFSGCIGAHVHVCTYCISCVVFGDLITGGEEGGGQVYSKVSSD